jgi:Flp pilus assembly protein TadD
VDRDDTWRRQYFEARIRDDRQALLKLAKQPEALEQPPATICTLALLLGNTHMVPFLKEAHWRYPADLWINERLAKVLYVLATWAPSAQEATRCKEEVVGCYRAALAARPDSAVLRRDLAWALVDVGRLDEAAEVYKGLIKLQPDNPVAYAMLAGGLGHQQDVAGAIPLYEQLVEVAPKSPRALREFAFTLVAYPEAKYRDPARAVALAKKATELAPQDWHVWIILGVAHYRAGDWQAARAALVKSQELGPGRDGFDFGHGSSNSKPNIDWKTVDTVVCGWFFLAMTHWQLGHRDEAHKWYEQAVPWFDTYAISNAAKPRPVRTEAEKLLQIATLYEQAVRDHPESAAAHYKRGRFLSRSSGDKEAALRSLREAVRLDPNNVAAYFEIGYLLQGKEAWLDAAEAFFEVVRIDPGYHNAHHNAKDTAVYCVKQMPRVTRESAARTARVAREAVKLAPKDTALWHTLGIALSMGEDPDGAVAAFRRAIELAPRDGEAYIQHAGVLEKKADIDGAIDALRKGLNLVPEYYYARTRLVEMLLAKGDPDGAVAVLRPVADALAIGSILRSKGDLDGAIGTYRKAIESYNRSAPHRVALAGALAEAGDFDGATASYQKAIELAPHLPTTHNNLAWLLATYPEAKRRDPARAVLLARQAIELAPKEGTFYNTLGVAHYRAGDWQAAIDALNQSCQLRQGGDVFDWFFLAMAYQKLGKPDEARKRYDQAVGWMVKNSQTLAKVRQEADELRCFRREAEEVLELKKK